MDALLSLKSAAKSINTLFFNKFFAISCALPFGSAVNIRSTYFRYDLLNFTILGNSFLFNDLSKCEISSPTDEFPQRYLIFTLLCLTKSFINWIPI